jgi:hypothetical protein
MAIHPEGFRWKIYFTGHKQHRNNREYPKQASNVFRHQQLSGRNQQRGLRSRLLANPNRVNPLPYSNENDYRFDLAHPISQNIQRFGDESTRASDPRK